MDRQPLLKDGRLRSSALSLVRMLFSSFPVSSVTRQHGLQRAYLTQWMAVSACVYFSSFHYRAPFHIDLIKWNSAWPVEATTSNFQTLAAADTSQATNLIITANNFQGTQNSLLVENILTSTGPDATYVNALKGKPYMAGGKLQKHRSY